MRINWKRNLVAPMATFHGRLLLYSGVPDEWEIFTEQLPHYFTANGVTDKDQQQAILLSTCGTATYKLLKTLVTSAALTTKTLEEPIALVQDNHTPKLSIIMHCFHSTRASSSRMSRSQISWHNFETSHPTASTATQPKS